MIHMIIIHELGIRFEEPTEWNDKGVLNPAPARIGISDSVGMYIYI